MVAQLLLWQNCDLILSLLFLKRQDVFNEIWFKSSLKPFVKWVLAIDEQHIPSEHIGKTVGRFL